MPADPTDPRWGDYVPWFLRHDSVPGTGDFAGFFELVGYRVWQLFNFSEAPIPNLSHFGSRLDTTSLRLFRYDQTKVFQDQVRAYFLGKIDEEARTRMWADRKVIETSQRAQNAQRAVDLFTLNYAVPFPLPIDEGKNAALKKELAEAVAELKKVQATQLKQHENTIVIERMSVLESILRLVPSSDGLTALTKDIQRFMAKTQIAFNVEEDPPSIVPVDEPLLQREVINQLLPRLKSRFPERARELIKAYHDLAHGVRGDTIFVEAFKTFEEIARGVTGDRTFEFNRGHLTRHFPLLHPTIHDTMIKLAAHRGDEAGHGRAAPDPYEMRYLLFLICNSTLLLLDYPSST